MTNREQPADPLALLDRIVKAADDCEHCIRKDWRAAAKDELQTIRGSVVDLRAALATQGAPKAEAPADLPELLAWREARAAYVKTVEVYNAALQVVKAQEKAEGRYVPRNLTREYHAMSEASDAAQRCVPALLAALENPTALAHAQRPAPGLVNDSWATDWLTSRAEIHPLTANLVVRFARALAAKLAAAEKKYGYSDGWRDTHWLDECRQKLREHVDKGDPRDVAAYCAFLWHHGESTAAESTQRPAGPATPVSVRERIEALPVIGTSMANNRRRNLIDRDEVYRILDEGKS